MASFFQNTRSLIIFEGVIFTILGFLAVVIPGLSTLSIELFLGWLIFFSGLVQGYRSFAERQAPGFWGSLFTSILYVVFGLLLVIFPIAGIMSLTMLLIIFFILEGLSKIYLGFEIHPWQKGIWFTINGIIALLMAFIIWQGWPGTAFWVLGLLVGINMIFFGISLMYLGYALPKQNNP